MQMRLTSEPSSEEPWPSVKLILFFFWLKQNTNIERCSIGIFLLTWKIIINYLSCCTGCFLALLLSRMRPKTVLFATTHKQYAVTVFSILHPLRWSVVSYVNKKSRERSNKRCFSDSFVRSAFSTLFIFRCSSLREGRWVNRWKPHFLNVSVQCSAVCVTTRDLTCIFFFEETHRCLSRSNRKHERNNKQSKESQFPYAFIYAREEKAKDLPKFSPVHKRKFLPLSYAYW
jgi:hypothetical protein